MPDVCTVSYRHRIYLNPRGGTPRYKGKDAFEKFWKQYLKGSGVVFCMYHMKVFFLPLGGTNSKATHYLTLSNFQ